MADLPEPEWPEARTRTRVAQHPDSARVHSLIAGGKTDAWIAGWLQSKYPVKDEHGGETPDAQRNKRWALSARVLSNYRKKWMPEATPGVEIVPHDLEESVGFRLPATEAGPDFELGVLEFVIHSGLSAVGRAVKSDQEMEMLQSVTLEAHKSLLDAVESRAKLAMKLGKKGYEVVPERVHQKIDQQVSSRNVNVELQGQVGLDGQVHASDPSKVSAVQELMALTSERSDEIINRAEDVVRARVDDVEGTAEDA